MWSSRARNIRRQLRRSRQRGQILLAVAVAALAAAVAGNIFMKPVIKLENVEKTYQTGEVEVKAVRGISLEIFQGEFVALMGASGSGKSTMMNVIGCLDRP